MSFEINVEEVLTWETKKLWNTLNTLRNDTDNNITEEDYFLIKFGNKIKCPIWYFTENWYDIYPSSKRVGVKGHGKFYLKDFMDEKEDRDKLMRSIIIAHANANGVIEGRV
jgi:hypothetical protein